MSQARGTLRLTVNRFRAAAGAIDLASILVGVLVMGILGSVIAASVFVVIPWAQDSAARSSLDGVKTAQSVSQVKDGKFQNLAELVASKYITGTPLLDTAVNAAGDCYVSAVVSGSGTAFYRTSRDNAVLDDKAGPPDTSWCVNSTRLVSDPVVNLATNPSAETSGGGPVTVRTNMLSNPTVEASAGWWQVYGTAAGISQTTTRSFSGTGSLRIAPTGGGYQGAQSFVSPVVAGTPYTFSGHVYRESGTGGSSVAIEWRDSANSAISQSSASMNATAGAWQRYSTTAVAPATATQAFAIVRYTSATANVDVMHIDALLFEALPTLGTYFDGSIGSGDPDLTNVWTGAAHQTTSVQRGTGVAGVIMNTGLWAKGHRSTAWSSAGSASIKMMNQGAHGDQFLDIAPTLPLEADKVYTFAAKVKTTASISDPNQIRVRYNLSGVGDLWGTSGLTGPPGEYDFRVSSSTAGMTSVNFFRIMNGLNQPGLISYWDDIMLIEIPDLAHPYIGPYFDGSSANGVWNGAANASTSTGYIRR